MCFYAVYSFLRSKGSPLHLGLPRGGTQAHSSQEVGVLSLGTGLCWVHHKPTQTNTDQHRSTQISAHCAETNTNSLQTVQRTCCGPHEDFCGGDAREKHLASRFPGILGQAGLKWVNTDWFQGTGLTTVFPDAKDVRPKAVRGATKPSSVSGKRETAAGHSFPAHTQLRSAVPKI